MMRKATEGYITPIEGGCLIRIDASPGASRTEAVGVNEWRHALQVRIAAKPKEGEANEELIRFISEALSVPRKSISIVSGHRSSAKVIKVPLTEKEVKRAFGE